MSHCSASVAGGTEIILLCHEVDKQDIEVRFFEIRDGRVHWESKGEFLPAHVHKKVRYKNHYTAVSILSRKK